MTPPPGTVAAVPPWLLSELAGFLARGKAQPGEAATPAAARMRAGSSSATDQVLSILNPGYGGRASPSKKGLGRARETGQAQLLPDEQ